MVRVACESLHTKPEFFMEARFALASVDHCPPPSDLPRQQEKAKATALKGVVKNGGVCLHWVTHLVST